MYIKTTWVEGAEPGITAAALNNIENTIDSERTIPAAGGTATAITATAYHFTLTTGVCIIFIAAADNGSAPTTINVNSLGAKSIYKPGTTVAPRIIAGRVYALWYNGTSFYVNETDDTVKVTAISSSRALTLADAGSYLYVNGTGAVTITIPTHASVPFPIGTRIVVYSQMSYDVIFYGDQPPVLLSLNAYKKISGLNGRVELVKILNDYWMLSGDLKA